MRQSLSLTEVQVVRWELNPGYGGFNRARTCDPLINSQVLYRLSYKTGWVVPTGDRLQPLPNLGSALFELWN